jgi:hypothetical protein
MIACLLFEYLFKPLLSYDVIIPPQKSTDISLLLPTKNFITWRDHVLMIARLLFEYFYFFQWNAHRNNRGQVFFYFLLPEPFLTLTLLTWRIWWAPNNASRWQMRFNLAFKGLIFLEVNLYSESCEVGHSFTQPADSYGITRGHCSINWPPVYLKLCHSFTFTSMTCILSSTCPCWLTYRIV